jgi:hypothetical protein
MVLWHLQRIWGVESLSGGASEFAGKAGYLDQMIMRPMIPPRKVLDLLQRHTSNYNYTKLSYFSIKQYNYFVCTPRTLPRTKEKQRRRSRHGHRRWQQRRRRSSSCRKGVGWLWTRGNLASRTLDY